MPYSRTKKKNHTTNRTEFLEKLDAIMPWDRLETLVRPYYYGLVQGDVHCRLMLMIRIYMLQYVYNMSDIDIQFEIMDSRSFTAFCHMEPGETVPDGDLIGRFRNLLIRNGIREQFFALVDKSLNSYGLAIKKGTVINCIIEAGPPAAKKTK